jgi:hypothetical protein
MASVAIAMGAIIALALALPDAVVACESIALNLAAREIAWTPIRGRRVAVALDAVIGVRVVLGFGATMSLITAPRQNATARVTLTRRDAPPVTIATTGAPFPLAWASAIALAGSIASAMQVPITLTRHGVRMRGTLTIRIARRVVMGFVLSVSALILIGIAGAIGWIAIAVLFGAWGLRAWRSRAKDLSELIADHGAVYRFDDAGVAATTSIAVVTGAGATT